MSWCLRAVLASVTAAPMVAYISSLLLDVEQNSWLVDHRIQWILFQALLWNICTSPPVSGEFSEASRESKPLPYLLSSQRACVTVIYGDCSHYPGQQTQLGNTTASASLGVQCCWFAWDHWWYPAQVVPLAHSLLGLLCTSDWGFWQTSRGPLVFSLLLMCPEWRKTQLVFQMLPSNHPMRCSNYDLHCHGESQWKDGAAYPCSYLKVLPVNCTLQTRCKWWHVIWKGGRQMSLVVRAGVPQVLLQFPFGCFNGPVFLFFFFSFFWGHKEGSGACPNSFKECSRVPRECHNTCVG